MEETKADQVKKTGTTTVGLVCKDAVVLASDKRATMGYYIASKDVLKIAQINDTIAMTIAGGVGDAQSLIRWMKAEIKLYELKNGRKMSVEAASTLLANILSQYKFYPFFVQILVGGMDNKGRVFSVDMLGGVTEETYTATGSGSPIAMGLIEDIYRPDLELKDGIKTAVRAVNTAMKRDSASGEGVSVMVITKNGTELLSTKEIKKYC
ncbi:archaeal proteasome endopeptidase complex subunit beta [Candidatus Micrarchaeota archaeon]|nr:archaeal proteasome endopeptidase complex subunit beta [Candidatus Micrarchaeota archaeon]MBD3417766.1 archaeal proteasome endopeptidase complex subunit beta [Candidatus Micrarchaeota archaeon]